MKITINVDELTFAESEDEIEEITSSNAKQGMVVSCRFSGVCEYNGIIIIMELTDDTLYYIAPHMMLQDNQVKLGEDLVENTHTVEFCKCMMIRGMQGAMLPCICGCIEKNIRHYNSVFGEVSPDYQYSLCTETNHESLEYHLITRELIPNIDPSGFSPHTLCIDGSGAKSAGKK